MAPNTKTSPKDIYIHNYISEKSSEILSFINEHNEVLINASPGSGKTTFFAELCINHIQKKKPGRIIFCTPFLIIQSQFKTKIKKAGYYVDFELNHKNPRKKLLDSDKIISTTYDSLPQISNTLASDDKIIVDEAHSLLFTYGFGKLRKFFNKTIFSLYETNAKIILMTGTPYSGVTQILNLKELRIKKENLKAKINVQYSNDKETSVALSFAENCLIDFGKESLNIIYIKNTRKCKDIARVIQDNLNVKAYVLTAERKDGAVYKELEINSLISQDISFLVTTNVISTGANILNDNIGKALMLNEHNPTEIKQFSKRFRKKMDIEIDVVNKIYNQNELASEDNTQELIRERNYSRIYYEYILSSIESTHQGYHDKIYFDRHYFPDVHTGSRNDLMEKVIERMVIQEAYYAEKIAESYNNPEQLINALNTYEDVISVETDDYAYTYSSEDLGESYHELLDKFNNLSFTLEFIKHDIAYLQNAYWFLHRTKQIHQRNRLKIYLHENNIETRLLNRADLNEDLQKVFQEKDYIKKYCLPLIDVDDFIKDIKKSIYFLGTTIKNKRAPLLISLHTNYLFNNYLKLNKEDYPTMAPTLIYAKSTTKKLLKDNPSLHTSLKVIMLSFEYLTNHNLINYEDFNDYLVEKCKFKVKANKDDTLLSEIDIDFKTKEVKNFKKNLLKGIMHGLFYMDPKQKYKTHKGERKNHYVFKKSLPKINTAINQIEKEDLQRIHECTEILNYEMVTRDFSYPQLNNSTRVINNHDLILYSFCDNEYYYALED